MKQLMVLVCMIVLGAYIFMLIAGSGGIGDHTKRLYHTIYQNRLGIEQIDDMGD